MTPSFAKGHSDGEAAKLNIDRYDRDADYRRGWEAGSELRSTVVEALTKPPKRPPGRPRLSPEAVMGSLCVRLTPAQRETLSRIGGVKALRAWLDGQAD